MGQDFAFLTGPIQILQNLNYAFTFLLLVLRFAGMMLIIPGLGGAAKGIAIRYPMILVFAFTAMYSSPIVELPSNLVVLSLAFVSEILVGLALGMIPLIMVGTVQNAGQLASTSMGLQAGAMMDPSTGGSVSDISRLFGDLLTITLFFVGGHHVLIYAASGLGGRLEPGSFVLGGQTIELLIQRSADIFKLGMVFAAPIIVALLLTQFVMGLISKAVPTVNIFIVSFPLTIGIGLVLMVLMLPELFKALEPLIASIESQASIVLQEARIR